jgi:hypothetical protein
VLETVTRWSSAGQFLTTHSIKLKENFQYCSLLEKELKHANVGVLHTNSRKGIIHAEVCTVRQGIFRELF